MSFCLSRFDNLIIFNGLSRIGEIGLIVFVIEAGGRDVIFYNRSN